MRIASPNFKNISRHTVARDVLMYYAKDRDHVKEELAKAPDWKLQKRIIRFRALFPPYDGLHIVDKLFLCLSQWGIDKKIFSITLDNASYNDVMVSCLKNHFRANRAILCDGDVFHVRCCAHILNIIVKAGLELADDVVDFVETILNNLRLLFNEYVKKSNPRLPLWLGVLMFQIKILLILVCINTMLIVLILGEVLIKVMIINVK
ncbi:hypothetical protein Gotur_035512 [Gossypium turneri]